MYYSENKRNKGICLRTIPESYVVVDIETTGLSPVFASIIEISAKKVYPSKVEEFSVLINPGRPLPPNITTLTGITDEMLKDKGGIEEAITSFIAFLGNNVMVGHNVNFDINFLYDASIKYLGKALSNDFVDTMVLGRALHPELGHHRLADLAQLYGIDYSHAHRALEDCKITRIVLEHFRNELKD